MATVTVSIGRNVGSVPMTAPRWAQFIRQVRGILTHVADVVFVDADHSGEWDGVTEDGHTWVAQVEDYSVPFVECQLASLARMHKQDAIALTVGTTTLVTPARSRESVAV